MEVIRQEVPLYGQAEVTAVFQNTAIEPEEAELYVFIEGSTLTHVTPAKRSQGPSLCFTVPGHDVPEMVLVTPFLYTEEGVKPCGGSAPLEYVRDVAQELAEYLSDNRECLSPRSYLEVLKRLHTHQGGQDEELSPGEDDGGGGDAPITPEDEAALKELDEKITQAMANMDYPQHWTTSEGSELHPRETLLHLAVRLDLLHLAQFLIHQPGSQRALALPNQDGDTPLQLAQRCREHTIFRILATQPVPAVCPAVVVWSDSSTVLRLCPGTDSLTLTMQNVSASPEDSIVVLRDKMSGQGILKQIAMHRGDIQVGDNAKDEEEQHSDTDIGKDLLSVGGLVLLDNVFEEQLVLSLDDDDDDDDDDDEELLSSVPVKGHPVQSRAVRNQLTDFAGVPLVSTICSSARANTQLNQVVDADGTYPLSGVTSDSTGTDGRATVGLDDTPPHLNIPPSAPLSITTSPPLSIPASPPLSLAGKALARLARNAVSDLDNPRESPPLESCDLSPSLVSLELDSEEDCVVPKSPFSNLSSDTQSSGDQMDACLPSPDLTCTRTKSSSACDHTAAKFLFKELGDSGIRLRSYSYSSSKMSLRPPRFSRAADLSPDGVPHNVSYSRSLLQALSLSKSLSLLHPGKQRASSLTEQSQEKREVRFRKRAQSADDEGSMELPESLQHLTLSEFLKEIEEEEFDKYSIPSKVESEKYKVIRTFSFLKSRMTSTRKNKGKGKDREAKDRLNGHRFASGPCMGFTVCLVCDKPATGKELLHCSSCTVMVHKACKDSVPPCLKVLQDKYVVSKNKTASLPQNFTVRESASPCTPPVSSASLPAMASKERKDTTPVSSPLSGGFHSASDRLSEGSETESDSWRVLSQSDEAQQNVASSTSTESSLGEDCVDTCLHGNLTADGDFEAESWSLAMGDKFCKSQDKRVVKRQDVIYELMQTEVHHLQTLHIMAEVFRRGMREEVQLDAEALERVFPCLDLLLLFHHNLFSAMRERQQSSVQPQGQRCYIIRTIGDILLQQFSDDNADRMKQIYGEFCSHHNEAVSYFKELQQHNKRFQAFIKQQSNNSLVRRKEIPECILLVTQRITKYPVLLERILQYTQEDTEEHADLLKALTQIREVIVAVNARVSLYERGQRLQDVWSRMENRSSAKLKNGHTFRKQDMMWPGQTLKHQGLVLWKTATGRLKDVLALLLTDTLIFLQEKDQKYIFATVDQKPPVISLQKLIVREVANEERGMFLISASSAGPEMYEVHTASKDERNTWMRLIREAVESCPEEEEECVSESEEDKRAAEARLQKIQKFQESLMSQDQQICSNLEEKLQIYAELSALSRGVEPPQPGPRLLVRPHPEEPPQVAVYLSAALQEAERLRAVLSSRACSPSSPGRDSGTDAVFPAEPFTPPEPGSDCELLPGESNDGGWADSLAPKSLHRQQKGDPAGVNLKVAQSVQSLTQLLYSLQASVIIQDSCCQVQRLLLSPGERPSSRQPPHLRGHTLQEQEKQRNVEKRREEVAAAQRLRGQLRHEIQRWEKECQARQSQQGELESRLEERERRCHLEAERLQQEREQLEQQLEEYQQSLERLREGQRSVERERERLDTQQKLLPSWRHSRHSSLATRGPAMVIPLDGQTVPNADGGGGVGGSVFLNEAALTGGGGGVNNRHRGGDPSAHNCLNKLLARSAHRQSHTPAGLLGPERMPGGDHQTHGYIREGLSPAATRADQYLGLPHTSDARLDLNMLVSLETENGEDGREENIVYL